MGSFLFLAAALPATVHSPSRYPRYTVASSYRGYMDELILMLSCGNL